MHFLNTWEIDSAVDHHRHHPVLGPASRLLAALRDLVDANSDGWCSWPAPVRAADKLMTLLENPETATDEAFRKAITPIKAFCTRYKLYFPDYTLTPEQKTARNRKVQLGLEPEDEVDIDQLVEGMTGTECREALGAMLYAVSIGDDLQVLEVAKGLLGAD